MTRAATLRAASADALVRVDTPSLIGLAAPAARLTLTPRRIRAVDSGGYLARLKGRGMEFAEARPYQDGDDLRTIDWRVTARTGRPYTKLFREERERPVLLALDLRAAMHFATEGCFKSVQAARAAVLLAWAAVQNGDRVGGIVIEDRAHRELRPQRGRHAVLRFVQRIVDARGWQRHAVRAPLPLADALGALDRVTRPGSLVCLFSDFHDLDDAAVARLEELARHAEIVLVHVHDRLDDALPPPGRYALEIAGHRTLLDAADRRVRERHAARAAERRERLGALARRPNVRVLPVATREDALKRLAVLFGRR